VSSALPFPIALDRPLVFIDLETTGLDFARDRIVELAVLRLSPGGDVSERVRRFNPGIPIPPEATAVHGIRDEDVADEPPFPRVARSLADLLEPCDLAGFNIRRFDLPMLLAEFRRSGIQFDVQARRVIDVQMIFHRQEPRDLSAAARFYLGESHEEAHTALGDIRTTARVLAAQLQRYAELPRDMEGLHGYCDEVRPYETEVDRWFEDPSGRAIFRRGRHRGRSLDEVAADSPDYLDWMLRAEEMDEGVLNLVREALARLRGGGL
jgi:DNA polymerase III subunit epsilon